MRNGQISGHDFNDGKCKRCDMTSEQFMDKDSKDFRQPCRGRTPRERPIPIEE